MKPASYHSDEAPDDYVCAECGASGVKLWREYSAFQPTLLCLPCSEKEQQLLLRDDVIGWRTPAIPDEEGVGWWGYTSVPQAGIDWWQRLPSMPANKNPMCSAAEMARAALA